MRPRHLRPALPLRLRRAAAVATAVLMTAAGLVAGAVPAQAAGPDWVYFGDGEASITAGANGVIRAHGAIRSVPFCLPGGTNDFVFPVADVYVVRTGSASPGGDLAQADGTKPATIIGFGSTGAFLEEPLAVTGPQGALGEGVYDVVVNNCQDGVYRPAYDSVFPRAITVRYPAKLPPYSDGIGDMKRKAAESAAIWVTTSILIRALQGVYDVKDPKSLTDAIMNSPGTFLDLVDDFLKWTKKFRPASGGPTAALQGAVNLAAAEANRYLAIAEDPPDHDYAQPTVVAPITTDPASSSFGPLAAAEALAAPAATETALAEAFLHALERYQGATYANDGQWALVHARELRQLSFALASAAEVTADAATGLRGALDELTRWDETVQAMVVEAGRLRGGTWTPEQRRTLLNLGLTAEQMTELHADLSDVSAFGSAGVRSIARMQETLDDLTAQQHDTAAELRAYADRLEEVIDGLEAQSAVPNALPAAHAGDGYDATAGEPLTLDGSGSAAGTGGAIVGYEWDVDGDGAFGDATGVSPTVVPAVDAPGIVGLRVTAEDGAVAIAYAPLRIDRGDPPIVDHEGPSSVVAMVGVPFSRSASIVGGTGEWLLDGEPVGTGDTWAFTPAVDDLGVYHLDLIATAPGGARTVRSWMLAVVDRDGDGDGWAVTADCDDADALVHPGRTEVPGNGIDDDCEPATSDTPLDALAGAVASWGALPEADAIVLGRQAGNAELAGTPADVSGLGDVRRVAAGHRMGLAVTESGALWAWGHGAGGQLGRGGNADAATPVAVAGLSGTGQLGVEGARVVDAVTDRLGLALLADGTAAAWGPNPSGALGTGSARASENVPALVRGPGGDPLGSVTAIASGRSFAAVIAGDDVYVTGGVCDTSAGRTAVPLAGLPAAATAIAAGDGHLLIALADGSLHGCGANDRGQLGEGPRTIGEPVEIELGDDAARPARLAAGAGFSLVLDADGSVWAFGRDDAGQLGDGESGGERPAPGPVALPEGAAITGVDAGGDRAAITRADGTLVTWGRGIPSPSVAELPAGAVVARAALGETGEITYAVLSRERPLVAWGVAPSGVAGPGLLNEFGPTTTALPSFRDVRFNGAAGAGIGSDGLVWSWGRAAHLGAGHTGPGGPTRSEPGPVLGIGGIEGSQLRARTLAHDVGGSGKFAAILDGGQVAVWGDSGGHSGDGVAAGYRPHPTLVLDPAGAEPLTGVAHLSVSTHGNLAVLDDGRVLGFSSGPPDPCSAQGSGNLGDLPVHIAAVGDDIRQAAVMQHTGTSFFLTRDGELLSCGVGGQIGRTLPPGTPGWRVGQVEGMGPGSVVQIAAGLQNAMVLKSDGTVWGWGQDYRCSLGCTPGQSEPDRVRALPEQIHLPEGPPVVALVNWTTAAFAIRADGSVLGWGWNLHGQTGLPASDSVEVPTVVPMPQDRPVASIDAAITSDLMKSLAIAQVGDPLERLQEVRGVGIEVSVETASVVEGGVAEVPVTLNHPARVDLEVAYETADATAIAGVDYVASSGRVVIAAGETRAVIAVPAIDDETWQHEHERVFEVRLSDPPGWAGIAQRVGEVAIADDDPEPVVSISGPGGAAEGDTGTSDVEFAIVLDRPSAAPVSVAWRTVDGTATAGADYIPASGVANFEPGRTRVSVPVGVNGDTILEADEAFSVELFDPRGGVGIGDASADAVIVDDEPVLVETTDRAIEAPSERTVMAFTISTPQVLPGESVDVPWSVTAPWLEGEELDAVSGSGTVTLTSEQPAAVVEVVVDPAERAEPQRFRVDTVGAESSEGRAVIAAPGTGTIGAVDPPAPVAVIAGPTEVAEGAAAVYGAASSTGAGVLAYAWDLDGDGEFDDADAVDVEVRFDAFGTRTIGLRVTDDRGETAVTARTVTIDNVAPTVSLPGDVEIARGETLEVEGGFADPGANTWIASVDYGFGIEPLALDGDGFVLRHTYTTAGVFPVTVRVCDDGDACGLATITVTVSAPAPAIIGIEPARGPEAGGTRVTITGTDLFLPAGMMSGAEASPRVTFGDSAGLDTVCEATAEGDACVVTTPAHEPGAVDVTLTRGDGATFTAEGGFVFEAEPEPGPGPGPGPGPAPGPGPGQGPGQGPGDPGPDAEGPSPGGVADTGGELAVWAIVLGLGALAAGGLLLAVRRRHPGSGEIPGEGS